MAKMTNLQLWDNIRAAFPTFSSHTSKGTKEMFTAAGYEKLKNFDATTLNEFFELSMRVYLQTVNISHAVDRLENSGFGEYYDQPHGGFIQRLAISSVKPVTPVYDKLVDGQSVDPFVVRKPEVSERFFKQNFDYQSLITVPDDFQMKQIFISEFGMSEFIAGIMAGLTNGYTTQVYLNKLEAINAGLNSKDNPLKDTQKVNITLSPEPTGEELTEFILKVKNVVTTMETNPQTGAFNTMGWESVQDISRLKLLVRAPFSNEVSVKVLTSAFNPENLNLPVDVILVDNFGGLEPYKEAAFTTKLHPVYDKLGAVIGYNEAAGQSSVTVQTDKVHWKDPNEKTFAVLADKGWLFHSVQNPYSLEPIRNPRGLYTNYWASSPNNAICIDPLYNVVVFQQGG